MSSVPDRVVEIRRMHAAYVRLTGLSVVLDLAGYRERLWFDWLRMGWTEGDLAVVVGYVKRCIARNERGFNYGTLKFGSLVGQVDRFEELLAEARAVGRGRGGDQARAAVLRESGRGEAEIRNPKSEIRSAGAIAAGVISDPGRAAAALEELRKMKANL